MYQIKVYNNGSIFQYIVYYYFGSCDEPSESLAFLCDANFICEKCPNRCASECTQSLPLFCESAACGANRTSKECARTNSHADSHVDFTVPRHNESLSNRRYVE